MRGKPSDGEGHSLGSSSSRPSKQLAAALSGRICWGCLSHCAPVDMFGVLARLCSSKHELIGRKPELGEPLACSTQRTGDKKARVSAARESCLRRFLWSPWILLHTLHKTSTETQTTAETRGRQHKTGKSCRGESGCPIERGRRATVLENGFCPEIRSPSSDPRRAISRLARISCLALNARRERERVRATKRRTAASSFQWAFY